MKIAKFSSTGTSSYHYHTKNRLLYFSFQIRKQRSVMADRCYQEQRKTFKKRKYELTKTNQQKTAPGRSNQDEDQDKMSTSSLFVSSNNAKQTSVSDEEDGEDEKKKRTKYHLDENDKDVKNDKGNLPKPKEDLRFISSSYSSYSAPVYTTVAAGGGVMVMSPKTHNFGHDNQQQYGTSQDEKSPSNDLVYRGGTDMNQGGEQPQQEYIGDTGNEQVDDYGRYEYNHEEKDEDDTSFHGSNRMRSIDIPTTTTTTTTTDGNNNSRNLKWSFNRFSHRCAGCSYISTSHEQEQNTEKKLATLWCCDCSRAYCNECDEKLHEPNIDDNGTGVGTGGIDPLGRPMCSHRVEYITDEGGISILTPIFEILVLLGCLVWTFGSFWEQHSTTTTNNTSNYNGNYNNNHHHHHHQSYNYLMTNNIEDYFFESICPSIQWTRRLIFRLDHVLFPLVQGQLNELCQTEDTFIKIFTDVWVRSIVTQTDSLALILMQIPYTIEAIVLVLFVAPFLAVPYAIMATTLRLVETSDASSPMIPGNSTWIKVIARIVQWINGMIWLPLKIASFLCRLTILGLVMDPTMTTTTTPSSSSSSSSPSSTAWINANPSSMSMGSAFQQQQHRYLPPKTGHRKRPIPSYGWKDITIYGTISRISRIFLYFHYQARRIIFDMIITMVFWVFALRIFLLIVPRDCIGNVDGTSIDGDDDLNNNNNNKNTRQMEDNSDKCLTWDTLVRIFFISLVTGKWKSLVVKGGDGEDSSWYSSFYSVNESSDTLHSFTSSGTATGYFNGNHNNKKSHRFLASTENDILNETLLRILSTIYEKYIGTSSSTGKKDPTSQSIISFWRIIKIMMLIIFFFIVFFAGAIRRMIIYIDHHNRTQQAVTVVHRQREHRQRQSELQEKEQERQRQLQEQEE